MGGQKLGNQDSFSWLDCRSGLFVVGMEERKHVFVIISDCLFGIYII